MNKKLSSALMVYVLIGLLLISIEYNSENEITVCAQVGTSVGGYVSANTTWTTSGSPYIVEETVIVEPNVALSIDPGVEVRFASGTELIIDGELTASGNSENYITFTSNATSPQAGDWGAIRFMETSDDESCIINWAISDMHQQACMLMGVPLKLKTQELSIMRILEFTRHQFPFSLRI